MNSSTGVGSKSTYYYGPHRVLVNEYLDALHGVDDFDVCCEIDRKLANAFSIHVANKIESYARQAIEAEVSHVNECLGLHMTYVEFLMLDELYAEFLNKYDSLRFLLDKLFLDEVKNFVSVKSIFLQSLPELCGAGFLSHVNEVSDVFLLGDESHDGNKNITLFYVNGRPGFALKLRDLALEKKTSQFLERFFREKCGIAGWIFPKYIEGDNFGWVTWCDQSALGKREEVETYYKLSGYLIAIAASLGITDLHYENIVTHGGKPVPIDLEAVFHHVYVNAPRLGVPRTGLVPNIIKYTNGVADTEHAGIGNIFRKESVTNASSNSNPNKVVFEGVVQNPLDYIEHIISGCKECFAVIMAEREYLIEFLNQAFKLKTRTILRDTANYCMVIDASFHPRLLKSNDERRSYIDSCLRTYSDHRADSTLVDAEVEACFLGDVPRFTSSAKVLTVNSAHASDEIELINYVSGYDSVIRNLKDFVNGGFHKEVQFLECAYREAEQVVDQEIDSSGRSDATVYPLGGVSMDSTRIQIQNAAQHIIDFKSSPLIFTSRSENYLELAAVGNDLFSGTGGLGYLASIGKLFDAEKDNNGFSLAYSELIVDGEFLSSSPVGGAYVGTLSSIAPLFIVSDSSARADATAKIVAAFNTGEYKNLGSGLTYGLAGALVLASCYFKVSNQNEWRDIANLIFVELVSRCESEGPQIIFPSDISKHPKKILCGLSHGQAGIAYSLGIYSLIFDVVDKELFRLISGVVMAEVKCFSYHLGNWPDLRNRPRNVEFQDEFGWAHGGAGIIYAYNFLATHFKLEVLDAFFEKENKCVKWFEQGISNFWQGNSSISNGPLGTELIYRRLYERILDQNFESKSKVFIGSATLGYGLMKGCVGKYLALTSLINNDQSFPLLPHELFKFRLKEACE